MQIIQRRGGLNEQLSKYPYLSQVELNHRSGLSKLLDLGMFISL